MKIILFAALLSFSVSAFAKARFPLFSCRFETPATIVEQSESHLFEYWDFATDAAATSSALTHDAAFASYRKQVSKALPTAPIGLLERYAKAVPSDGDEVNRARVVADVAHYIRPINCIESLLLDQQIHRTPAMPAAPTEFLAVYLKNTDGRLRVYMLTDDLNGVRKMDALFAQIKIDQAAGWVVTASLHNHSFWLDNVDKDELTHPQGVLAPSTNDVQVFRGLKDSMTLLSASITNGFDTVTIPAEEFGAFAAPVP